MLGVLDSFKLSTEKKNSYFENGGTPYKVRCSVEKMSPYLGSVFCILIKRSSSHFPFKISYSDKDLTVLSEILRCLFVVFACFLGK